MMGSGRQCPLLSFCLPSVPLLSQPPQKGTRAAPPIPASCQNIPLRPGRRLQPPRSTDTPNSAPSP